jgi:hypothetical protein
MTQLFLYRLLKTIDFCDKDVAIGWNFFLLKLRMFLLRGLQYRVPSISQPLRKFPVDISFFFLAIEGWFLVHWYIQLRGAFRPC